MADIILPSLPEEWNAGHRAVFIEAAPLTDVLFDQFEYLVSHAQQECPPGCPDCERLRQIKKLLLVPFESPDTLTAPKSTVI